MQAQMKSRCRSCNKLTARKGYKYCSNACQQEYQYQHFIKKWKAGEASGMRNIGVVARPIKRYLREKFDNKCCLCGWAQVNVKTGLVPLVADHKDGNYQNNKESNLRLICPNCDAISSTYGALKNIER